MDAVTASLRIQPSIIFLLRLPSPLFQSYSKGNVFHKRTYLLKSLQLSFNRPAHLEAVWPRMNISVVPAQIWTNAPCVSGSPDREGSKHWKEKLSS